MATSSAPLGPLAWVDLTTTDLDGAAAFYAAVLGWSLESVQTPVGRYVTGSVAAGPVAGMMAPPPGQPAHVPSAWALFFRAADAAGTFDRALGLGASALQPPTEVPGGSTVAVVADPAGAVVGFMEPGPGVVAARGAAGAVAWAETQSRDVEASAAFYQGLGWEAVPEEDGYRVLEADGEQVAGLMAMPAEVPAAVPSYWAAYFAVDDVDAACARVREHGGSVVVPVMHMQDMRFAFVADPAGAGFALLESTR